MSEQKPPSGKKSKPRATSPTPASGEPPVAATPPPAAPQVAPSAGTPAPAPDAAGQAAGQQPPVHGTASGAAPTQQPGGMPPNAATQQGGHPQQGGYPPQPQQGGQPYPPGSQPQPQQGGYPPQPHQGGYLPQQGGQPYPPGYPPQPGYPPRPGGPQPPRNYVPRAPAAPPRPPLSPRQRRGAMLAGAVSFTLMSLGFSLIAIPLIIGVLGAFIGTIVSWAAENDSDDFSVNGGPQPQEIESFISDAWSTFLPWLVGALILGIIIWILGYFSSLWILRGHDVHRPVAVTWSGLGIAVVGNFFLSALSSPVTGLFNVWDDDRGGPGDGSNFGGPDQMQWLDNVNLAPAALGLALLFLLISVVVNAAIGLLSWWWMAHAFRDPAPSGRDQGDAAANQNRPPAATTRS